MIYKNTKTGILATLIEIKENGNLVLMNVETGEIIENISFLEFNALWENTQGPGPKLKEFISWLAENNLK